VTPINFDAAGLIPVVAQDVATGDVLLLAYMNAEALRRTLEERVLVLWSRSRQAIWRKGEQSGHMLRISELRVNCEGNSLLARVTLDGPGACHDGYRSCYYRRLAAKGNIFTTEVLAPRTFDPAVVYGAGTAEEHARALYAAYERLRDTDLTATSGTSRRLRARDRDATSRHALARAHEELEELRGVLGGTHRHQGLPADVILEASQVSYWVMVAAIALGYVYDAWQPHMAWLAGWAGTDATPSDTIDGGAAAAPLAACVALLVETGALCREAGVRPENILASDLAALRAKHPAGS
jgi:phosphoribosyl-AMP cyclohydrolase